MALVVETVHGLATTLPFTVMVTSAACIVALASANIAANKIPTFAPFHEHLQLLIFKSEGSRGIDMPRSDRHLCRH